MRTLICEFQPFHVSTTTEFLEFETTAGRRRIPVQNDGQKTGTPGRHYHYAYVGDKPVKRGDWALVHNGDTFGIVEIKRVVPGIESVVTKHVIEVLTKEEFKAYLERNERIDEMRSALENLEFRLEQKKKLDKYEALAEEDPEAAKILQRLKTFFGMNTNPQIEAASSAEEPEDRAVTREKIDEARGEGVVQDTGE